MDIEITENNQQYNLGDITRFKLKAINNILSSFEPISLNQMDEVKLMNRTDTKFVFEYSLLEKVMEEIKAHYYVLDMDGVRPNAYRLIF